MRWTISLLCSSVWLFLLCLSPVCPAADRPSNCRYNQRNQIQQRTQSTRRFCDPSFNNPPAGALTQKCSSGFYRERVGPFRGWCVPCRCSGLSDECDEHTGNCVNCRFNTTGDRCERCKEGYYGNAAAKTCRACPCPFTRNNFAVACLDIGWGVVDCLCKKGYSGARCERCAFGYYGNPVVEGGSCKACSCDNNEFCDSLTGECITPGDSSSDGHCQECESCTVGLLVDLEKVDKVLAQWNWPLQNITVDPASHSTLNHLEILVRSFGYALRLPDSRVEQLVGDVDVVREDSSQLIEKALTITSNVEKVLQNVNEPFSKAEDLLFEAEALLSATQDVMRRITEEKPAESATLSENSQARMMEEVQLLLQQMRRSGCTAQRHKARRERKEAHALLDPIRNMVEKTNPIALNQTAGSVMASHSSLWEMAELLSDARDRLGRMQGLNLKSAALLQHLEHLHPQLEREKHGLLPVTEMTQDLLTNISDVFLMMVEIKKKFEGHGAQLDGAKVELIKKLNIIFPIMAKVDMVTEAEEHAEELNRVVAEFQRMLHDATKSARPLGALGTGVYTNILNAIEKAEMAANQSTVAADQALKDGDLVNRAAGLKDDSSRLWTEAKETESELKVTSHRDRVDKQKEKGESLRNGISTVHNDIKNIKREDTKLLIESAKTAASAANSTVSNITERLTNISLELEKITLPKGIEDHILTDAEQTLKGLNKTLPALEDKITQVEALSRKAPSSANMTESIRGIKEIIQETRNYVNKLSLATSFNGKGHVELRPPGDLDDIKAFTAVDLLISWHQNSPSQADRKRKRRQDKRRGASFFVLYLGNKDATGDYIGMAIRNKVLICVYKLGGLVHEVETSQIMATTVNSSHFDRVVFHRVYQDAEVNVTQNFNLQKPVHLAPKRHLPNTTSGILDLDPGSVVFYVGGYPEDFTPPTELNYPKFRGAMKLSYINDSPVCLFNYMRAVGMDAKEPIVRHPRSDVTNYYEGTGYRMVFIKDPDKNKSRYFSFHTSSRETNALLFYIGNEESFFWVVLERGFLVLQGRQAGRELRVQSVEKVSLFDVNFSVKVGNKLSVHYGKKQITADHIRSKYLSYYIGGLPAWLRERHNIGAPPLRGCLDHLSLNDDVVDYTTTIGVVDGCPVSLLGVRSATVHSPLSADSLFVRGDQPLQVSLGFRSMNRNGILLRSGSPGSDSVHSFQLSLADGYAVFNSDSYTLRSARRYSDGRWHYLSAVRRPAGLELIIDNVRETPGGSARSRSPEKPMEGTEFAGCITNLYTRRPEQIFSPADLSLFSREGDDVVLGQCSLVPPANAQDLPAPAFKIPQKHTPIQTPAGSLCRSRQTQGEYQLSEEDSWLSYTLPQEDLNHRPHFSLDIKTKSSKGLILHVAGRGVVPLLALYMANGKIKMSLGQNRIIQHQQKSNDGNWHRVELSVEKNTFHLLVDGLRVTDGQLPNSEGSSLDLFNPVYLGGGPGNKRTNGHGVPTKGVIGCVRNFKMNEEVIWEPKGSQKILPCSSSLTEMGTYFGGGHIVLEKHFSVGSQFALAFEMRPQRLTGLLFHVQNRKTSLAVFINETKVGAEVSGGNGAVDVSVTPPGNLCDGRFHSVTVSKQLDVIKLEVDSLSEEKAVPFPSNSHPTALDTLYVGGTAKATSASVSSPFVGCLRNVRLNGRLVALETRSRVVGPVSDRCPADRRHGGHG